MLEIRSSSESTGSHAPWHSYNPRSGSKYMVGLTIDQDKEPDHHDLSNPVKSLRPCRSFPMHYNSLTRTTLTQPLVQSCKCRRLVPGLCIHLSFNLSSRLNSLAPVSYIKKARSTSYTTTSASRRRRLRPCNAMRFRVASMIPTLP
ncbi:hypothetical protein AVEN_13624-1 [Araneus ventricosus]|uniref:Uncharacterized protein n=1 Tax=Araneus ventricosus TaxID=182803 RepID=A0A4Y2FMV4_ARAVE|nr:hypothetical protein AVEN_13624-1 [Araneus ventricosus]